MSSMEPGWLAEELTPRLADWCALRPSEASARIEALTKELERLRTIREQTIGTLMLMQIAMRSKDYADVMTHISLLLTDITALSVPSQEGGK